MRPLLALFLLSCASPGMVREPRKSRPLTDREVFSIGLRALVEIATIHDREEGQSIGYGSGMVIGFDKDGKQLVLTAAHVVDTADLPVIRAALDQPHEADYVTTGGHVVAHDRVHDLALIQLEVALDRTPVKLGKEPRQGDPVWYFEAPPDLATLFGRGTMLRAFPPGHKHDFEYLGSTFYGGSGGGVLDEYGQLVGTIVAVERMEDPHAEGQYIVYEDVGYAVEQRALAAFLGKAGVL